MSNRETHICRDYVQTLVYGAHRPVDAVPDWEDYPSCFKIYRQVERLPLPTVLPARLASLADVLARMRAPYPAGTGLSFEALATTLLLAQGVLSRRLGVDGRRKHGQALYAQVATAYSRGTTTGAGMHPTEIYWACGPGGPLLPGLYHYDGAHHALERLYTGDMTRRIQAAVSHHPSAMATDQFLLVALNFWRSAFVQHALCYHVATQDLGALLCSLRFLALGFGSELQFLLWYQDEALNRLLGLDTLAESVFAVVPVPAPVPPTLGVTREQTRLFPVPGRPLVTRESFQRSKAVIPFPESERVHLASLIETELRPDMSEALKACLEEEQQTEARVDLPPPAAERLHSDVAQVFQQRTSSANRFSGHIPLARAELATLLSFGAAARSYLSDLKQADGSPHVTRLLVCVNNVEGIAKGAYAYQSEQHCLWTIRLGDVTDFLPRDYFLPKYNVRETGVVIAITGNLDRMLEVYGNRGYRLLNAEVGIVLQSLYLAAAALALGSGWKLGTDSRGLNEALGLKGLGQRVLLFVLLGYERPGKASFDGRLV